jgi:hypothetical protein
MVFMSGNVVLVGGDCQRGEVGRPGQCRPNTTTGVARAATSTALLANKTKPVLGFRGQLARSRPTAPVRTEIDAGSAGHSPRMHRFLIPTPIHHTNGDFPLHHQQLAAGFR